MKKHKFHQRFRKVAAGPYSFSNIKKMEPMIDDRMVEWADAMRDRFVKTGEAFDLCDWCKSSTITVVA
jgi:cytochrome P450